MKMSDLTPSVRHVVMGDDSRSKQFAPSGSFSSERPVREPRAPRSKENFVRTIQRNPISNPNPNPAMPIGIGNRVYQRRMSLNMNQLSFAAKVGMSSRQLCKVEYSQTVPRLATLQAIADALRQKLDVILGDDADEYYRLVNRIKHNGVVNLNFNYSETTKRAAIDTLHKDINKEEEGMSTTRSDLYKLGTEHKEKIGGVKEILTAIDEAHNQMNLAVHQLKVRAESADFNKRQNNFMPCGSFLEEAGAYEVAAAKLNTLFLTLACILQNAGQSIDY